MSQKVEPLVLYHLATGKRPFGFPKSKRVLRKRLWRRPVPPRAIRPDIPAWFQEIVLHCLESDPDRRYPTAEQLAFDLRNPADVRITQRGERLTDTSFASNFRRWWQAASAGPAPVKSMSARIAAAPIIMAAVDLRDGAEIVSEALREAISRILRTAPGARLACVNILKTNRIALNYGLDDQGRNIHVQRLVALRDWARPLGLIAEQVTFHVLESPDPSQALLDYARKNQADQIIIGAGRSTPVQGSSGRVAQRVASEAPCTVTIVRPPPFFAHSDTAQRHI